MDIPPYRCTIEPRRVSFDFGRTPLHWIPGEPAASHLISALHLLLPAGERWFAKVLQEALPMVGDARLRADAEGFMGQEAIHSDQHERVLGHLADRGLDVRAFAGHVDRLFDVLLGERPPVWLPLGRREWLRLRLSLVAAMEQFTAVFGDWALHADGLDRADPDPAMLDLLRWHGAEEVEHRSVVFDVYQHTGGHRVPRYARRVEGMALTAPLLLVLWTYGAAHLIRNDPQLRGRLRYSLREHNKVVRKGLLPTWRALGAAVPRYLRRSYHPSQEGSLYTAVHYLAESPATRGTGDPTGRAAAS